MIRRLCCVYRPVRRLDEVNGFLDLGLFEDAMAAARELLQRRRINAEEFDACVNAILSCAPDLAPWRELIEGAYGRLTRNARPRCAHLMLWFHATQEDHERAAPFIPGKFSGPFAFVNLLFAMSTYLGLKRLDKAQRLLPRCQRAARVAGNPEMRLMLGDVLEAYQRELQTVRATMVRAQGAMA
jgi:hypothetical protein